MGIGFLPDAPHHWLPLIFAILTRSEWDAKREERFAMIQTLFTPESSVLSNLPDHGQGAQLYLHAAIGTAAGILFGIAYAMSSLLAGNGAGAYGSAAAIAGFSVHQVAPVASNPSPEPVAAQPETSVVPALAAPMAPPVPIAPSASVAPRARVASAFHSAPRIAATVVSGLRPIPAHKTPAFTRESVARVEAKHEIVAEPLGFSVEGDATVVDYDASVGVLTTSGSETFVVATAASESGAIHWQDYPVNVHYRCNRVADCTLVHAGQVVSHVRLGIQSERFRQSDVATVNGDAPTTDTSVPFVDLLSRGGR